MHCVTPLLHARRWHGSFFLLFSFPDAARPAQHLVQCVFSTRGDMTTFPRARSMWTIQRPCLDHVSLVGPWHPCRAGMLGSDYQPADVCGHCHPSSVVHQFILAAFFLPKNRTCDRELVDTNVLVSIREISLRSCRSDAKQSAKVTLL